MREWCYRTAFPLLILERMQPYGLAGDWTGGLQAVLALVQPLERAEYFLEKIHP